ncbi:MAG: VCBS repeat-containing protein [Gammaproteobacteria bacterium]|nr:VCBS repeat-containing protein [Gammaproteobacteria bacterium]
MARLTKYNFTISIAITFFISLPRVYAQDNYVPYELVRDSNWDQFITEDINGDGAKDIIFSHYDPIIGRELRIHRQKEDGSFSSEPQSIEIKTEIIGLGFADLRKDPGKELLLVASNGVFSLSAAIEGYAGNIKQLAEWDLIASTPNLEEIQFIKKIDDINNDGYIDLVLPGKDNYGIFLGKGNEEFEILSTISTTNENLTAAERNNQEAALDARIGINPDDGVIVELKAERPSPFDGFIETWEPKSINSRALLRSESWMPPLILAELNGDQLQDLIYLNVNDRGEGQINIHYQSPEGFSQAADWHSPIETRGNIQIIDINNDGLQDIYRLSGDGSQWDARFYLNQNGQFQFTQPTQIMRFSGYDVRLDFINLNPIGQPVLNVNYYTIPVVDAIRNASINRVQLIYQSEGIESEQIFERRPSSRLEESFSAANVRGLSEQMSLKYDIDGDGANDALYITENGTLAAKRINESLQIADIPFWEYVSPRSVFEFEVLSLNKDNNPDLVIRHGTTTTFLVASP